MDIVDEKLAASSPGKASPQNNSLISDVESESAAIDDQKIQEIREASQRKDVKRLIELADSKGGFLTDELRQIAWPVLLGQITSDNSCDGTDDVAEEDWTKLPQHRDEDQVMLDVNRSFVYYPHRESEAQIKERRSELFSLIVSVLRLNPYLYYFQGYHDICQVFLLVLPSPSLRTSLVSRLSVLRIRDFMLSSLGPTTAQLRLLPDIIAKADPKLRKHLAGVEPYYALAGTLTMYSHNIEGYGDIARLFDALLAREPVFSIYMFAQIVVNRRDELFNFDEPDMLHVVLGKVPPRMDLDNLIVDSISLFKRYPPETLPAWRHIRSLSVLRTARDVEACARMTLDEGHEYFEQQAKHLRWIEVQDKVKMLVWAYRRPARNAGMAIAVGLMAFYLRRNPTVMHQIMTFFSR